MNHDMYSSKLQNRMLTGNESTHAKQSSTFSCIYRFRDIEHLIQLAHRLPLPFFDTQLIRYENGYYLAVLYPEHRVVRSHEWLEGVILEYGERTQITIHRLEEYGTVVISENAVSVIRDYFQQ